MDDWFRIAFVSLNAVSTTHYRLLRKLVICGFLQVFDPRTRAPYHRECAIHDNPYPKEQILENNTRTGLKFSGLAKHKCVV
jgi:hypothetical protein